MVDNCSPPPPQAAPEPPTQQHNHDNETVAAECRQQLPLDLNVIKDFIQHDKDNDNIPLLSAITLKNKRRMLFIPLEFHKVKIDALVDSGA